MMSYEDPIPKIPESCPARNIVICSDGTGNAGGRGNGSNVWRIRQAVKLAYNEETKSPDQIIIYEDGVGTQALTPARFFGGAFGYGMKKDLRILYGRLIREFKIHKLPDGTEVPDNLYLFGFSRGAFTIRVFANMLKLCGIADIWKEVTNEKGDLERIRRSPEEIDALADEALKAYARRIKTPNYPDSFRKDFGLRWKLGSVALEQKYYDDGSCDEDGSTCCGRFPIKFVGVWDTVDAVGLPFD